MTAAAERRVDVDAVVADRERCERFVEEDGNMAAIACVGIRQRQRLKPCRPGGKPPGNVIVCAICACHFISSHNSSFWPWPTSTTRLSRPA